MIILPMDSPRAMPLPVSTQQIITFANSVKNIAALARQRRLLSLSGTAAWCQQAAIAITQEADEAQLLWVTNQPPPQVPAIGLGQAARALGRELQYVIYDAHGGFDADALGAVSGLVRGGGLLLLLTPPLDDWPMQPDPEAKRFMAELDGQGHSCFIERLCRVLTGRDGAYCISESGGLPELETVPAPQADTKHQKPYATEDQRLAVAAIINTAIGHGHHPTVLLSDRGRGKSAALGIAAARLLQRGVGRIVVTAPRLNAVSAVFEHAHCLLPDAHYSKSALRHNNLSLQFMAPDELILGDHNADVLLVDEAAAIPAPMLSELLQRYPHIVFASTVHGYEGSGRGFALRFNQVLDDATPGWQRVRMETPVRWANNDPLEKLVFDALLLNATIAPHETLTEISNEQTVVECLRGDQLLQNECLLSQLFGLLVLAHYRTRPNDLRQLLDSPGLSIYIMRQGGVLVGTVLVVDEGRLDDALAHAVYRGQRRLRGHLIPQTLAAYAGMPDAARLRYARIMRIAIHPELQRKGFGEQLLKQVLAECRKRRVDVVGASFGITEGLLDFWQRSGFSAVRVGLAREHSSGTHSVVVLHPLSENGEIIRQGAVFRLHQRLPYLLKDQLKDFDSVIASRLLMPESDQGNVDASEYSERDIAAFAHANLGMETVMPQLHQLARDYFSGVNKAALDEREKTLLLTKIIQNKAWAAVCRVSGVSGKKEGLSALRRVVAKLIDYSSTGT